MIELLIDSSNYSVNFFSVPMFITAIMILLLGFMVFIQNRNRVSKSFFILTTSASVWQMGIGMIYLMKNPELIIPFYKYFTFLGVVLIAPSIYLLTVTSLGLFDEKKNHAIVNYAVAIAFYLLGIFTDKLAVGIKDFFWGPYVIYGPLSIPFLAFFCILIIVSLGKYLKTIKEMKEGIKRDQIKLLFVSLTIAIIAVVDFISCFPPFEVYPFGYVPVICFISLQTYALMHYQNASLSMVFNSMEDGIMVISSNGKIVAMNPSAEIMLGIERQELLGKSPMKVISLLENRISYPGQVNDLLNEIITSLSSIKDEEIKLSEPDLQINVSTSLITDRFGTISGKVVSLKDVTERKRMERELSEYRNKLERLVETRTNELMKSEEKYKILVSHAQVGIGIHMDGSMVFANEQFLRMLGFEEEELIGMPIGKLIHPDEAKTVLKAAFERYEGKEVKETYDLRIIKKDGTILPAIISNATIEYMNRRATLITIVDTTDTKIRKELQMANKELEMFAYSVSHDLRAPLRSINGFSKALLEDYGNQLNDVARDYLIRIVAAGQRMDSFINSILKLSRLGRCEIKKGEIDLSALACEIANNLKNEEPNRKVDFVIAENVIASGDAILLRTVLENLIGNAWKFTEKHETAKIEFGNFKKDGKTVYFVQDDGAGFEMKNSDKLFIPFKRLHSDQDFQGTGVGLSSVQRIIRRHGGDVWAESAVEEGATFYFTLE